MSEAILAFHDNDDKPVVVEDNSEDSFGLICENQGAVEEAASIFLSSGSEAIRVVAL